ncbi:hypothetical protein AAHC03_026668 [Spirometra sp. Aus1]
MTSILPNELADFGSKSYWEHFFSRLSSAFEWYGDFESLSATFSGNIRRTDKILEIGCGNSELCCQIYDKLGCQSYLGIDTSETAVYKARRLYADPTTRPGLAFEKLDAFSLVSELRHKGFELPHFNCIIDKGTLDAIHSGGSSEEHIKSYFEQITSLSCLFGRYILITLAQEHIVRSIANFFFRTGSEWLVTFVQVNRPAPSKVAGQRLALPVFSVICIKMHSSPMLPRLRMQTLGCEKPGQWMSGSPSDLGQQLLDWVKQCQQECLLLSTLQAEAPQEFYLHDALAGVPLFLCKMVLRKDIKHRDSPTPIQAVFLAPLWGNATTATAFVSTKGQNMLLKSMGLVSGLFVLPNPNVLFGSLEVAKTSLSNTLSLSPVATLVKSLPIYSAPDVYPNITAEKCGPFTLLSPCAPCDSCFLSTPLDPHVFLLHSAHPCPQSQTWLACSGYFRHLLVWLSAWVSTAGPGVYFGLPPCIPLPVCQRIVCVSLNNFLLSDSPLSVEELGILRAVVSRLCEPPAIRKQKTDIPTNERPPSFLWCDEVSSLPADVAWIIYDPLLRHGQDYLNHFSPFVLEKLLSLAETKLQPGGMLLIVARQILDPSSREKGTPVETVHKLLAEFPFLGKVLSYEVTPRYLGETPVRLLALIKLSSAKEEPEAPALLESLCALERTPSQFLQHINSSLRFTTFPHEQVVETLATSSWPCVKCILGRLSKT